MRKSTRLARQQSQRGLTLVELMVGIAVGLFVVAGATMVVTTQLGDNRRLLLETQLQQDLRATADIITRELRRAGASGNPTAVLWFPGAVPAANPLAAIELQDDDQTVRFDYRRNQQQGPWGFTLSNGVIRSIVGGGWQDLTDANTMNVTDFRVRPLVSATSTLPCPTACSADPDDTACWPTLTVRTYEFEIAAQAVSDASVQRSIRSQVRVRNDQVRFSDPLNPTQVCPP